MRSYYSYVGNELPGAQDLNSYSYEILMQVGCEVIIDAKLGNSFTILHIKN